MNCQEGMDYMQRQLDGDLDDLEIEALTSHMQHCAQCAAMYERLQLLSDGLENLPKVTPPYSLVDAIMPRLAELASADVPKDEPEKPLPSRSERNAPLAAPVKRWRDRRSFRTMGGVVAAGLVVGLFLVTYNPFGSNPAGQEKSNAGLAAEAPEQVPASLYSANSSPTADQADAGAMTMNVPEQEQSEPGNKEDAAGKDLKGKTEPGAGDEPAAKPAEGNRSFGIESKPPSGESSSSSGSSSSSSSPSQPQGGKPSTGENRGMAPNLNYDIPNDGGEGSANGKSGSNSGNDSSAGYQVTEKHDKADQPPVGALEAGGGEPQNKVTQQHDKADVASEQEFLSPDGKYRAVILKKQFIIYIVADNKTLYMSDEAVIGNVVWDADSKHVTYEIVSDQGTQSVIVDPDAGTATNSSQK
ncbi:anti-sigma factor family protein [Paenibacillus sp. GCM10027626]|uniref:anti-sigma factor n=1 Tax=Paenibacillus sp. GCM10027626 TaxID=3273411 RepID=UPI00362D9A4B